jgi:hypothetical protein
MLIEKYREIGGNGKRMKQRFLFGVFFIACIVLLVACGGNGNTATSTGGSAASTPSTIVGNARAVNVTLSDTKIASSRVTFLANTPYDFTVTNTGHFPHDFIIRKRPEGAPIGQQNDQGVMHIISALPAGKTVRFTYGFPQASVNSTIQFEEHLAGKSASAGPIIPIQVTQAR